MKKQILIYGANSYIGKLFVKQLISKNLNPILAGNNKRISKLAQKYKCEVRVFDINNSSSFLEDIDILINLAGNYSETQSILMEACVATGTHYIDIADQVYDLKDAFKLDNKAKEARMIAIPGSGFGVMPTNIAAKMAMRELKDPTSLTIAYAIEGKTSRDSKKSFLEKASKPGFVVKNGKFRMAEGASRKLKFSVFGVNFNAVYNPWRADLVCSYQTKGIKNIETYTVYSNFAITLMKSKYDWLRELILKRFIGFIPDGPSLEDRKNGKTYVKAVATNANAEKVSVEIVGPDSNTFTVECLYEMVMILKSNHKNYGVKCPSSFGVGTIGRIEGVRVFSKYEKTATDSVGFVEELFN